MKNRKGTFAVTSTVHYFQKPGQETMALESSDLSFEVNGAIDKAIYFDGKGLPRKAIVMPITDALVMGLINHVQFCHDKGWEDSMKYLDFIKARLDAGMQPPKPDEHHLAEQGLKKQGE